MPIIVLVLIALNANAEERRCTDLGTECLCSEPLNTNTRDGGLPFPLLGDACYDSNCNIDFDDSQDAKECKYGGQWTGIQGNGSIVATPASEEPLPPGHSLSWVFKRGTPGHRTDVFSGPINEPINTTVCIRSYQRWSADSVLPDLDYARATNCQGNSQYKIMTIGGQDPTGAHNPMQLAVIDTSGVIVTRADGNWFNIPADFQALGKMQDCISNYCRFEMCIDLPPSGIANVRFRQVKLAPGATQTWTVTKPPAQTARNSISFGQGTAAVGWFTQCLPPPQTNNRFATHALTARHQPADTNWWPGPACEVEGGCSGVVPPLNAPARPKLVSFLFPVKFF